MRGQKHEPTDATRKMVVDYRLGGMIHEHIAAALKISPDTLTLKYAAELASVTPEDTEAEWREKFEKSARQRMLAADCPPVLIIFGLKAKCGWREQTPLDPLKETPADGLGIDALRARVAEAARAARDEAERAGRPAGATGARRSAA